jgi:hypothetical protein
MREPIASSAYDAAMPKLGARGGKMGGKPQPETMTPKERREVAMKAAKARWESKKGQKSPSS